MAVNWNWSDKIGELQTEYMTLNIYKGINAFVVFIYEEGNQYTLHDYFSDEEYAKMFLGLKKGRYGEQTNEMDGRWKGIKLNKDDKDAMKLASFVLQAKWKDGITISLVDASAFSENSKSVHTHNITSDIICEMEKVLDRYDITVPSPEDDERGKDNCARLYGTVYSDLVDNIETILIELCNKVMNGSKVIPYVYGKDNDDEKY